MENYYINPTNQIGIDGVGEGSFAGSIIFTAVYLEDPSIKIHDLDDSKKIKEGKREEIFEAIKSEKSIKYWIAESTVDEINQFKLKGAKELVMKRLIKLVNIDINSVITDFNVHIPDNIKDITESFKKGDSKFKSIAAASIISKVTRDNELRKMSLEYPQYKWDKNKGYGTKDHIMMIKENGPCPYHRTQYISKHVKESQN